MPPLSETGDNNLERPQLSMQHTTEVQPVRADQSCRNALTADQRRPHIQAIRTTTTNGVPTQSGEDYTHILTFDRS